MKTTTKDEDEHEHDHDDESRRESSVRSRIGRVTSYE
jgi:hypothetical protein